MDNISHFMPSFVELSIGSSHGGQNRTWITQNQLMTYSMEASSLYIISHKSKHHICSWLDLPLITLITRHSRSKINSEAAWNASSSNIKQFTCSQKHSDLQWSKIEHPWYENYHSIKNLKFVSEVLQTNFSSTYITVTKYIYVQYKLSLCIMSSASMLVDKHTLKCCYCRWRVI